MQAVRRCQNFENVYLGIWNNDSGLTYYKFVVKAKTNFSFNMNQIFA